MNKNVKKYFFYTMATTFSLLILLTFCEILIRLLVDDTSYHKFNHRSEEYYHNRNDYYDLLRYDGEDPIYGIHYRETSQGYRLPDKKRDTAAINQLKWEADILFIGDSFTFGQGVKYKDRFSSLLDEKLKGSYSLKNCAARGADIDDIEMIFMREIKSTKKQVFYAFVLNDFGLPEYTDHGPDLVDQNNGDYIYAPLKKYWKTYWFFSRQKELRRISNKTVKAYLQAFRSENNILEKLNRIKRMNQVAEKKGVKFTLLIFPLFWDFESYPLKEIHDLLLKYTKENKISSIDLLPLYQHKKASYWWAAETDHHPNEFAHKELFSLLDKRLSGEESERK